MPLGNNEAMDYILNISKTDKSLERKMVSGMFSPELNGLMRELVNLRETNTHLSENYARLKSSIKSQRHEIKNRETCLEGLSLELRKLRKANSEQNAEGLRRSNLFSKAQEEMESLRRANTSLEQTIESLLVTNASLKPETGVSVLKPSDCKLEIVDPTLDLKDIEERLAKESKDAKRLAIRAGFRVLVACVMLVMALVLVLGFGGILAVVLSA